MIELDISTSKKNEMVDITEKVRTFLGEEGTANGVCVIYVPHTTAGITINEGADPAVARDILRCLEKASPESGSYEHAGGAMRIRT